MSRSGAAILAKQQNLLHVGMGYYADKSGKIAFKSHDGMTLSPLNPKEVKDNQKTVAITATQKDPTMPNLLGEPSKTKPTLPKVKKKKSLVEFTNSYPFNKREKNYNVKYRIPETGTKQHVITIRALNSTDAAAKAKAFIAKVKLIGTPQLAKSI